MTDKKLLASIFLIVFINLLGFSFILPLLPFYAETFGANPTLVGLLVASYAAAQLIGAPLLGRLSDRYGRKPILIVSIAGTVLSFIILGLAKSLIVLFLARIFDGLTGGNISVAQAYITDVTDEKNRGRGLGLIGAAFGLGFILGPAMGGFLSQWGYALPAFAAAGIAMISLLLVIFWLPESLTTEKRQEISNHPKPPFTIRALVDALQRPFVGQLLHTRLFFAFAFSTFQTIFSLYAQYRFGLDARNTGYILAYVGLLAVLVQGLAIGPLTTRFNDQQLIFSATILMSISLLGWGFAPNIVWLLIVLAPIALAGGVLNTVINSAISKSVPRVEAGGMLGISASLESFTRAISPAAGGFLLGRLGTSAPGIVSGVLLIWLSTYVWRHILQKTPASTSAIKSQ